MLRLHGIVAHAREAVVAQRLHALEHHGAVEYLYVPDGEARRRRLRLKTDCGTDCALSIKPNETLVDGAVVLLEVGRAIVVRIGPPETLTFRPADMEAALRLGWHAGNLHWRVGFHKSDLVITLDGPRKDYLDRIQPFIETGSVCVVPGPELEHEHSDDSHEP